MFKVNDLNAKKNEFEDLEITILRRFILAHPISYNLNREKVSFKIIRNSIFQNGKVEVNDQSNSFKSYDIFEALNRYQTVAENIMEIVSNKLIENTSNLDSNKINELKTDKCRL